MREKLAMPELRRARLRQLLKMVPVVKTIEVHSGLTGLIAEKTVIAEENHIDQFEAMWISSLCDSTEKGKPDIELVDMTSRFRTINDIMEVTTKEQDSDHAPRSGDCQQPDSGRRTPSSRHFPRHLLC